MRDRKTKPGSRVRSEAGKPESPPDAADQAFDIFLARGLHKLYDDVASQPLPPELLRMIEEDRKSRGK